MKGVGSQRHSFVTARAVHALFCVRAGAGIARTCLLAFLVFLLLCASSVLPPVQHPTISVWCTEGLAYAEDLGHVPGRDVLENLEKRVIALLAPVYGAEHVVVQASHGEENSSGRSPVSLAVIIDTSVVPGFPSSPEGVAAEQERLASLISHAAGLRTARGDSIAISFLLFSNGQRTQDWLPYIVAVLAGCFLVVVLLRFLPRRKSQKSDTRSEQNVNTLTKSPDSNVPDEMLARLADRLRGERPQVRAVVLMQLSVQDAATTFRLLPRSMQAETLVCMTLQGHVEEDVLAMVRHEFLQGMPAGALCKDVMDPAQKSREVLTLFGSAQKKRLLEEAAELSRRAWEELT